MSEIRVTSRYAKALLDLAVEQNQLEEVKKDMLLFHDTVDANPELEAVLANPIINSDDKEKILNKLFNGKVSELTLKFFGIMIRKNREALLFSTSGEFAKQYNAHKGIVLAEVVSAAELTETQLAEINKLVTEIQPGTIQLSVKINPELIGGFIVTVGDKQYDASVVHQLRSLKKELTSTYYESKI